MSIKAGYKFNLFFSELCNPVDHTFKSRCVSVQIVVWCVIYDRLHPPPKLQEGERGKATIWWRKMIEQANRYGAKTGESETAGRSKVPYAVLTVHTLVTPSFPGWVAVIFPSGHPEKWSLAATIQYSLTLRGDVALFHFCRRSQVGKYSFKNRFQKWFETFWTSFQEWKTVVYLFLQKQWVGCLRMGGVEGSVWCKSFFVYWLVVDMGEWSRVQHQLGFG